MIEDVVLKQYFKERMDNRKIEEMIEDIILEQDRKEWMELLQHVVTEIEKIPCVEEKTQSE